MKKQMILLVSLLLTVCLLGGCAYLPAGLRPADNSTADVTATEDTVTISKEQYEKYQKLDKLLSLMDIAEANFYEDTDETDMVDGAAMGLLSALGDPYTFYYTAQEYADMWVDDKGVYAGVGIQISASFQTGLCTISRVFPGGPAEAAGVHKGDILYQVEDLLVTALNLNDAVNIMRGTPGTSVHVVMKRGETEMPYDLLRADIVVNRTDNMMLEGGIGYIALYEFAGDCVSAFEKALDSLQAQGAKGLILDLRDNPGGWVYDANDIGDLFMDEGTLCYLEYRNGEREYYKTTDGKTDLPLVVLINEHSASSSELLTAALQERADATVVGVTSYGKGIVQAVLPVGDDGSGMQITIAQYFTPNGTAVHKISITPDVECPLPEGDNGMYELGDMSDPQLSKAVEVMRDKLK